MVDSPHPYHESEHYVHPTTQVGFIREFMRHYLPGVEAREAIFAFMRIYGDRKLLHSMRENARLMQGVHLEQNSGKPELPLDMHFYYGELLAVHTILQSLSPHQRQTLLECDPLSTFRIEKTYRYGDEQLESMLGSLGRWQTEGYQAAMTCLDEELQGAILDLATHIYEDSGVTWEFESFLAGFMFAGNVLVVMPHVLDEIPEPPFYKGPV